MNENDQYTVEEKKELLQLARKTIENYLSGSKKEYPETDNPKFLEKRGVFVTLHKKGDLRGCIGYALPIKPLIEAVVDNAISSATEDHRFRPVSVDELADIDIELSILTVPQKVKSYEDVVVGRDGIIISKSFMKGLLLPQVPVEQGWDLEQYISWGCRKAGLPADEWKKGVDIETFQGIFFGEKEME
ncbi:MAG: AmmeMemoRadiSam system protein A [Candidatus Aminicenantes bacterium]|nr:MAG: AmmeMemoRadiSam system protein A [Candidatus Aminicenantes bacterium]